MILEDANMITAKETKILQGEAKPWELMPNHIHLYHREILSAEQADSMGIRASSILWERIDVGGQVLPHYHDVAEIIHITIGRVKLLCNGEWKSYKAGDTFQVPAGVIHSVANDDNQPTEQISIFLPAEHDTPLNSFFHTSLVEDIYSIKLK
jgi:mannose-6-phosphate isomerase-like protein (cupin superfamily)